MNNTPGPTPAPPAETPPPPAQAAETEIVASPTLALQPAPLDPPALPPAHRQTGKIGRLSQEVQDRICEMIRDGLTYNAIREKLGETGKDLKHYHFVRWKKRAYPLWLKKQEVREDTNALIKFILTLAPEQNARELHSAIQQIAASRVCQLVLSLDLPALKQKLQNDPQAVIRLLDSLPKLAKSGMDCERQRLETLDRRAALVDKRLSLISADPLRDVERQLELYGLRP